MDLTPEVTAIEQIELWVVTERAKSKIRRLNYTLNEI